MKYCPNCASMDTFRNSSGIEQCRRCNFAGEMKEGGIDEINSARKRAMIIKGQNTGSESAEKGKVELTNKELKERLAKLREKESKDIEVL